MKPTRRAFLAASAAAPVLAMASTRGASAQETKKYKACVIGDTDNGGYGHSLHLAWAHRPDVEVVAVADPNEEGRAKRAKEAGAARTYADYQEMLEKEKPDLVTIGPRWTPRHKEYLLAAADCGAHGLLEKPIAVDLAEADAMVDAVNAKNLKWAIAHNFRMSPVIRHVKKMVDDEKIIGYLFEARGRGKEDGRAGGEDLIVLGTHVFDMMAYFLGDAAWCASDITMNGKPATKDDVREASEPLGPILGNRIHSMFGFKYGIAGHFSSMISRDGNGGRWGIDLYGSRGVISIRMGVVPEVHLLRDPSWAPGGGDVKWEPLPGMPTVTMTNPDNERNAPIIDDLMAAIEDDRQPELNLESGRRAYEMIQATYEAHVRGERVALPLEERTHPLTRWS
ncbi:MAG: Gfo/Idh/MocA family oxidoreductase [bacterium]|nr:Gfo/Idh/MocA family oxidoreductase [bacterium]